MTNQGIHYIDLLRHLVGTPKTITAKKATQLVDVEVEDTFTALVEFENGCQGLVEVTTAARPDDFEASVSVLGENGTAVISGTATNELLTYTPDPSAKTSTFEAFKDQYGFGHDPFMADVVATLKTGRPHPTPLSEASLTVQFLNSLYRSAEDKCEIKFADRLPSKLLGRNDDKLRALYQREKVLCTL